VINIKINRPVVAYILFGFMVFVAMLYLRFPGGAVAQYLVSSVSERQPERLLLIDDVKPAIPPGLSIENVVVGLRNHPEANIRMERFQVRPSFWNLLKGKSSLILGGNMYGGSLSGNVDAVRFMRFQGPIQARLNVRDVSIQKCNFITMRMGRQISGKLTGLLTYRGDLDNFLSGSGSTEFILRNGSYPFLENIFGFNKLDFDKVEAQMDLKNGMLRINNLKLSGPKVHLTLKGDILLKGDIKNSQLEMTSSIEFPGQSNSKITMAIGGTIGNPTTRMM